MSTAAAIVVGVLMLWAFAEAFRWPIAPDAPLAAAVFISPSLAAPAVLAVVVGTVAGGGAAVTLRRRGRRWPLPAVSEQMRRRVSRWLDRGITGLAFQPLTAIPYKVFVVDASRRDFRVQHWMVATAVVRGPRMAAVAAASAIVAHATARVVAPEALSSVKVLLVVVGTGVFLVGWRLAWRFWSDAMDRVDE